MIGFILSDPLEKNVPKTALIHSGYLTKEILYNSLLVLVTLFPISTYHITAENKGEDMINMGLSDAFQESNDTMKCCNLLAVSYCPPFSLSRPCCIILGLVINYVSQKDFQHSTDRDTS